MFAKRYIIPIIILFVIGFLLYIPNLHNGLFWDDADWILNNSYIHSFSLSNLKFIFTHDSLAAINLTSNYYRPVLFLTFMANYIVGGANPVLYHVVNNVIHIFNALLLFIILEIFIKKRKVSIIASLLFLIHPLQTEAVTYVSGRGDPMSVFFMLLAFLIFVALKDKRKIFWGYVWSSVFLVLAILSRETAFLYPVYFVIFSMAFRHREKFMLSFKKSVFEAWPYWVISFIYGIMRLTVLNFQNTLNFYYNISNAYTQHLSYRIYTFIHAFTVYLRLIFVPTGLHMERDIVVNTSIWQWPVWLGALIIVAIVVTLFWLYRKENKAKVQMSNDKSNPKPKIQSNSRSSLTFGFGNLDLPKISDFRLWFFAWGIFFVSLGPTSGIFPINALIYEHWLYFSLFGFSVLLAYYLDIILDYLSAKIRPIFYIFLTLLLVYAGFLCVQTVRRNIIWGNTENFYKNILQYEPNNIRALNNLAMYYSDHNQLDKAKDLYWKAIDLNDVIPTPYYNLGNILRDQGDIAGALELYKKAVSVDPYFSYAYMNIAVIYASQGNLAGALDYLQQLSKIRPDDALVYLNIGKVQAALGRKSDAIQSLQRSIIYSADNSSLQTEATQLLNSLNK